MVRKLMVVLLVGAVICLGSVPALARGGKLQRWVTLQEYERETGKKITKFNEAPELAKLVKQGKLPPVEKRLPEEPLVLDPWDRIGKYGGALKQSWVGIGGIAGEIVDVIYEFPLTYSVDMLKVEPNIFKSWEVQEGGKVFIFHIRKGLKWSDGAPFTADDFIFWYEDIALNKELYPSPPSYLMVAGEVGKWEKIDDYTIKMTYAQPYGLLLLRLARWRPVPYNPKHYLKQFHPKYTPMDKIQKAMKAEGYSEWRDFFNYKAAYWQTPGTPTMTAWVQVNKVTDPVVRMARNPYYWKIDTAGNQLPYISEIHRVVSGDQEALLLKAISGDIDIIMGEYLGFLENITTLKKNEKKGNYTISPSSWNNQFGALFFNMSSKDPILRKAFRDKRFRVALSVAMNRKEVNDVIFKGMFRPSQPAPPEGPPFYGEKPMFRAYTEYDPDFANYLLDVLGFDKRDSAGMRLRPDGKPLQLVLMVNTWQPALVRIAEMLKKYWEDVGVGVTVKPLAPGLWSQRFNSGNYEIGVSTHTMTGWAPIFHPDRANTRPAWPSFRPNWAWGLWYQTGGKEGEEPPPAVKRLEEIARAYERELDRNRQIQMEKEVHMIHTDNLWVISVLTVPKNVYFHLISNRLKNVPRPCPMEMNPGQPSTWYIEE